MKNKKIKINNFEFILGDDAGFLFLILLGLFGFIGGIVESEILIVLIGLIFLIVGIGILLFIAKPRYCEKCSTLLERIPNEISFKEGVEEGDVYRKNIQYKCPKCGFVKHIGLRRVA